MRLIKSLVDIAVAVCYPIILLVAATVDRHDVVAQTNDLIWALILGQMLYDTKKNDV